MQSVSHEPPVDSKPEIINSTLVQPPQPNMRSPFMSSVTSAMNGPLPSADAVAIPTRPGSTPRLTHAYSSATPASAAAQSLSFTDLQYDRGVSPPVPALVSSLSANQPEQQSVDKLCFEAASLGISESTSKVSVTEMENECKSSTSDTSSVHALEVSFPLPTVQLCAPHTFLCFVHDSLQLCISLWPAYLHTHLPAHNTMCISACNSSAINLLS